MSTGKLKINVFDETIGKPLADAKVRLSSHNQPNKITEELITNVVGQIDTLELETPPIEYSLEPNSPMPYGEYDITVSKEGFENIIIEKIQILPDVTAEQNVFMTKGVQNSNLTFDLPPHTLYGEYPPKISENVIKDLPYSQSFVVLDQIAIPEYVIVHDGDPNDDNAPNYWVQYTDYIKNVASCEIYATWPIEAIKANVLTINSFTLNRVYTEWYRSKGKNFTITSSTAYDQKFVYGHNIFEEISNVVDELFSTFITKPQIQQPLFTQYCDGKNVTCPGWLSQWGSKDLAESGNDYMAILRSYYGGDIYLDTSNQISGIPSSYPGEVLQSGSQGDSVRLLQRQLNSISDNYPLINKIAVDGIYGENTINSVKTFQQIFGLPQSGSTDYATWYEISKIYTAVERLAETV